MSVVRESLSVCSHVHRRRYTDSNAAAFARARLWAGTSWVGGREEAWSLERVCRALAEDAVHAKGASDNVSVMVVAFDHPSANPKPRVV